MKVKREKIEMSLRRLPMAKLEIINSVLDQESPVFLNASRVSEATGAEARQLGGQVSSVARTTIDSNPVFYPVGNIEPFGTMTWRLNEDIFPKDELKKVVSYVFRDIQRWQKKVKK